MPVNQDRINYLLTQWLDKNISAPELNELSELLMEGRQDHQIENTFQSFINQLPDEGYADYKEADWEHLYQKIIQTPPATVINIDEEKRSARIWNWRRIAVAASILLILGLGTYIVISKRSEKSQPEIVKLPTDVKAPETNRAMITLADGTKVYLDSTDNGTLAQQGNIKLVKLANGQIAYQTATGEIIKEVKYNTLENPRGSKVIDMTLSDGSRVWLNAGSSVTYPVTFIGNERKVSITGEAYFEISHDNAKPFIVGKGEMQVQVLGTHFNVNAYDDEEEIKVTLLEGSVKVSNSGQAVTIKPGEQARLTSNLKPQTSNGIDLEEVMAWKNGTFYFSNTNIQTIMRQAARWYDVEIIYEGNVKDEFFGGTVPRTDNISQLIKALELTKTIKITVEGKKIIVKPFKG